MPRLQHGDVVPIGPAHVRLSVNPRARRLTLRVSAGQVTAVAPSARRLPEVVDFARKRADWIAEQIAAQPAPEPFAPGAVIRLRGEPVRLVAVPGRGAARLKDDQIISGGEGDAFARRVVNLLKREALADFQARTVMHAAALAQAQPKVSLFDPNGRWGSCTPARRTIRYSWRLISAPPFVLDYLAAHETAHLVEANHSRRFWALVERLHGDPRRARSWLKTHGPALQALGRQPTAPAAT
jgi:hypothetical protein